MRPFRYLPLAAVVLAGSCKSTDSTAPVVDVNALVDQSAVTTYAAAAMSASVPGLSPSVPVPPSSASSCAYSAADQRFNCAPVTVSGLTITRSYALLDASGHALSVPDPTAIAAIRTITDANGTLPGTGGVVTSMTINRHDDATMSDLHAATHLLNGTATETLNFVVAGLTYTSNDVSTTANLRLPKPTATSHWPLGGTITTDQTMTTSSLPGSTATHEVLAFDGTSVMTLTMTAFGTTTTCKIDLSKPGTAPLCS